MRHFQRFRLGVHEAPPEGNDPAEPVSFPNGPHGLDSGDPDDD